MTQTDKLKLNLPEYTDVVDIEQLNDNFRNIDSAITDTNGRLADTLSVNGIIKGNGRGDLEPAVPGTDYLMPNGDGTDLVVGFNEALNRVSLRSGDSVGNLIGKISKWLNDLGEVAFLNTVTKYNLTQSVQDSLERADTALQSAPVTSVNGQIGDVSLDLDSLPKVSSTDNGKFLRVVDGAWSAAEIPSANGVSF